MSEMNRYSHAGKRISRKKTKPSLQRVRGVR